MDHDTDHPDARHDLGAVPPPGPSRHPATGIARFPAARGQDYDLNWMLVDEPGRQRVVLTTDFAGGSLMVALGDRKRACAALRSLARDLEAAPSWTAAAPIEPAVA